MAFESEDLLLQALTHESYTHERGISASNERLEFLGDSVLGLVIGHHLYQAYPDRREGELTRMKSQAVSSEFLALRAQDLGLGEFLVLGKGEEASGGRSRTSVLADALEAVIGAVFLDLGFPAAQDFVMRMFSASLVDVSDLVKDFKGELQERTQKLYRGLPQYTVVQEEGPPHHKSFSVEVNFGSTKLGLGVGPSKKQAEQAAAQQALLRFEEVMGEVGPDDAAGA